MKKQYLIVLLILTFFALPAFAGYDSASIPEDRIPWSGYWWPKTSGKLALGYRGHPSPLEKYDAYVNGYYPGPATLRGLEKEYDPDAATWAGHCDDWAAAAILEPEPDHPGNLQGVHFRVGDKKGLLTLHYDNNYEIISYGKRYDDKIEKDINDIYPGGMTGFHQTLINYISHQGLPIVMDMDPGLQVWNYPIYRYEMEWYDEGNRRHVTCKVWMADDIVPPDYVGTLSHEKTYTYWLETDGNGEIRDAPGEWEGRSIDDHPDFLWFPFFSGNSPLLDHDTVNEIVRSEISDITDRFEENDSQEQAYLIDHLQKDRFYFASSEDEDWYKVALQEGDDFRVSAVSDNFLNIRILNSAGENIGTVFPDWIALNNVPETGIYYIKVYPAMSEYPYYSIQFYQSPAAILSHTPFERGWDTKVTILNTGGEDQNLRLNLFDTQGKKVSEKEFLLAPKNLETISFANLFSQHKGATAKIINLQGSAVPYGFFSYEQTGGLVNLPLDDKTSDTLFIPHVAVSEGWWTGVAISKPNSADSAQIIMKAYTSQGVPVGEKEFNIDPGQNKVDLIQKYWEDNMPENTAWIELSADNPVKGYVLWGNSIDPTNPGLSGISLMKSEQTAYTLYIPHLAVDSEWWTGITIINPGTEISFLTIQGYSSEGTLVQKDEMYIPAKGNWVSFVQSLFSEWDDNIAWIKITATRPVGGFQLFGRKTGELAATVIPNIKNTTTDLWVTQTLNTWWTGLVFMNPFEIKSDVLATPYDSKGYSLLTEGQYLWYNVPHGLGDQSKAVDVVEYLFPEIPSETACLQIRSEEPIFNMGIYGDASGKKLDVLFLDNLKN
ncbi:MAG: hypothetical protein GY749_43990 [Desulfobacteraceae bacterium]|nr:hypothetical protein [Desulfobacteraceae bacterium]